MVRSGYPMARPTRHRRWRVWAFGLALLLASVTVGYVLWGKGYISLWTPVDKRLSPCFHDFYRKYGRRLLGPVISDPQTRPWGVVQYTRNAALVCTENAGRQEARLAPLGRQLLTARFSRPVEAMAQAAVPPEVERRLSQFVAHNGGREIFGDPVSGVIRNDAEGRYEQYYEYLGVALPFDSQEPIMLPYGLWACGSPCAAPQTSPFQNQQAWVPAAKTFIQQAPLWARFMQFIEPIREAGGAASYRAGPLWDPVLNAIVLVTHNLVLMYNPQTDQVELAPVVPILYPDPPPPGDPPWEMLFRFLEDIGLAPYAGPPIGGTYTDPDTGMVVQRFERLIVEYAPEDAWLALGPVGIAYQQRVLEPAWKSWEPPIGGPYDLFLDVPTLQVSAQQPQWIWVTVAKDGQRQANVPLFVMIKVPEQAERPIVVNTTRTDANGIAVLTIPALPDAVGWTVDYWVCAYDLYQLHGCALGTYFVRMP